MARRPARPRVPGGRIDFPSLSQVPKQRYEREIEKARREGERFAICEFIAAMLGPDVAEVDRAHFDAEHIPAFWDWFDALVDPPTRGPCYAAALWVKTRMREVDFGSSR